MCVETKLFENKTKPKKVLKINSDMKNISTRKNKDYTTIFINHWTKNAILEANQKEDKLLFDENVRSIVKPSKNCLNELNVKYNNDDYLVRNFDNKDFIFLGVKFHVKQESEDKYVVDFNNVIKTHAFDNDNNFKKYQFNYQRLNEQIIAFKNHNLPFFLLEPTYQAITGSLMYF